MTLSSSNLNEIGDLYENIVSSDTNKLNEEPYIPKFDLKSLLTKKGIEAEKARKAEIEKKTNQGIVVKTDPKTDIGKRTGEYLANLGKSAETAINKLGGYGTPVVAKPKPSANQKPVPRTPENLKDPEFRRSGGWTGDPNAGRRSAPSGAPSARPPVTAKPTPARPAPSAQTGDRTKDLTTWAKANQSMISKVGTPQQRAILAAAKGGTPMPAPRPLSADIGDIKGAIQRSQERQAAQSGPMYSSPDVKSKMSDRTKTMLGLKDSYDIVLDYLLSQGHVDTLDEALYVMMEMDSKCIRSIVEAGPLLPGEPGKAPSSGYKEPVLPGEKRLTPKLKEPAPNTSKLPPA